MTRSAALLAASGVALVLGGALAGCAASEPAPRRFAPSEVLEDDQTPDAEDDLVALDVGDDELVGDEEDEVGFDDATGLPEGNAATLDDEASDLEDLASVMPADLPDELPEPPLADEELDAIDDVDGAGGGAPDTAFSPFARGLGDERGAGHVGLAAAGGTVDWWNRDYACAKRPMGGDCVCRGSRFNCQFPNAQPGRNRYLPPAAMAVVRKLEGKADRKRAIEELGRWLVPDGTPIFDGAGALRGTLTKTMNENMGRACWEGEASAGGKLVNARVVDRGGPCVKINFGQLKTMTAEGRGSRERFVYAFATGGHGSSWIPLAEVRKTSTRFRAYNTPTRRPTAFARTTYVAKAPEDYRDRAGKTCTAATFTDTACLPAAAQLKVRPESDDTVSEKARDYLLRPKAVLNLAYQTPLLGGAATDTFLVAQDTLAFERARSVDTNRRTILRIWLYETKDAKHAGKKRVGRQYFVYGKMAGRFGWVAAGAIKKGTVRARAAADACAGKPDGWRCDASDPAAAALCAGGRAAEQRRCADASKRCAADGSGAATLNPDATLLCR